MMAETTVLDVADVGADTVALTLETPADFDADPGQFVLVRATIDGEDETGYYTLSSPDTDETFEITVAVDPDGTLGPWIAALNSGEQLTIDGPYGDIAYTGTGGATILASGPGIGPAVGIGERARASGEPVRILYDGTEPAHAARLEALEGDGAVIDVGAGDLAERLRSVEEPHQVYVFGFASFIERATEALEAAGIDPDDAEIENFGPE